MNSHSIRVVTCSETGNLVAIAPAGKCFRSNKGHRIVIAEKMFFPSKDEKLAAIAKAIPPDPFEQCECLRCCQMRGQAITGGSIKLLMRKHHVSIQALAERMQITMRLVRLRRETGLEKPAYARDWVQAITGVDPGEKLDYNPPRATKKKGSKKSAS